jgi:hypothetical protein
MGGGRLVVPGALPLIDLLLEAAPGAVMQAPAGALIGHGRSDP